MVIRKKGIVNGDIIYEKAHRNRYKNRWYSFWKKKLWHFKNIYSSLKTFLKSLLIPRWNRYNPPEYLGHFPHCPRVVIYHGSFSVSALFENNEAKRNFRGGMSVGINQSRTRNFPRSRYERKREARNKRSGRMIHWQVDRLGNRAGLATRAQRDKHVGCCRCTRMNRINWSRLKLIFPVSLLRTSKLHEVNVGQWEKYRSTWP